MPTDQALGATIRRLREAQAPLSIEALAGKAGLTLNTVTRLELGQSDPSWSTVRKVAEGLGVSLAELGGQIEAHEH